MFAARLAVWDPTYGLQTSTTQEYDGVIQFGFEHRPWEPVTPSFRDAVPSVFVDGVQRTDATLTTPDGMAPIAALVSIAAGAVQLTPGQPATWGPDKLLRIAYTTSPEFLLPTQQIEWEPTLVDPKLPLMDSVRIGIDADRRAAERHIIRTMDTYAMDIWADGPVPNNLPGRVGGIVKSNHTAYLPPDKAAIINTMKAGQRTPIISLCDDNHVPKKLMWWVKLSNNFVGWSSVIRCETHPRGNPTIEEFADRSSLLLPGLASSPHKDARSPQNLVPVGHLEKRLRTKLVNPDVVRRMIQRSLSSSPGM